MDERPLHDAPLPPEGEDDTPLAPGGTHRTTIEACTECFLTEPERYRTIYTRPLDIR